LTRAAPGHAMSAAPTAETADTAETTETATTECSIAEMATEFDMHNQETRSLRADPGMQGTQNDAIYVRAGSAEVRAYLYYEPNGVRFKWISEAVEWPARRVRMVARLGDCTLTDVVPGRAWPLEFSDTEQRGDVLLPCDWAAVPRLVYAMLTAQLM